MTAAELSALVAELAADEGVWRPRVHHLPDRRTYELLLHDEDVMAWVISWMDDHDTGFHDHDVSSGAVHVVQGLILEERLRIGRDPVARTFGPGATFDFSSSDIHRVAHAGGGPAVTIHAYSPPLWRMGAYEIDAGGELRRHSLSYAEELRPLAAA
ncbi:MAG: cysteine dioxygenase type [Solirubrobacterales bacterium]|jgi:predicted metal-dependent enzyme (double-stranded beta helix superfamily)|nr:cysteine dioxygenase type [Solirubrobacterales bacterium]